MPEAKHIKRPTPYASGAEICTVFHKEISGLYLLSLFLVADREKAEQCFVSGLEDLLKGSPVLKEWARSRARRAIIQSAVRTINPRPMEQTPLSNSASLKIDGTTTQAEQVEIAAVLELGPFERFVYVMSVLERYSDRDCSTLLGCVMRDVIAARIRALQRIGSALKGGLP